MTGDFRRFHQDAMRALDEEARERMDRLSYAILESTDRHKLETQVIEYMRDGWQVTGGVTCVENNSYIWYSQAVVRR